MQPDLNTMSLPLPVGAVSQSFEKLSKERRMVARLREANGFTQKVTLYFLAERLRLSKPLESGPQVSTRVRKRTKFRGKRRTYNNYSMHDVQREVMEKNSTIGIIASLLLLVSTIAFLPAPARSQSQPQRARDVEIVGATREEIESGSSKQINLWAVVIGISTYKYGDQDLNGYRIKNLKNAGDDAQAVYDFLKTPEGGAFRDESEGGHLILLKDEQATKANVERELAKLKQAKPNDFFVIFIAAHGVLLPDSDPEANTSSLNPYFVLYDTDVRPPQHKETAIRMSAFQQVVRDIPAQKGMVLTDTCHSAGVQIAGRGAGDPTRLANAAYIDAMNKINSGVGFISSAGQLEISTENDELNQGVFTYALLQGLSGIADANSDGKVTFSEVEEYLRKEVPKLSNDQQHPTANTTAVEANFLALSVARYSDDRARKGPDRPGLLVIRTPDLDGVEVAIDGNRFDTFNRGIQRSVLTPPGPRNVSFTKGEMKSSRQVKVESGRPTVVEVNLTFSESDEDDLADPTGKQFNVYLTEDKQPSKEAKDLFDKGVEGFKKQRFEEAAGYFNRAVQANNGAYANALVYLGRSQQSLGHNEAAVKSFERALTLRPTDYETKTFLAEANVNLGNNEEAMREIKKIVASHPNDAYARVVYAEVMLRRRDLVNPAGDFAGAERQLRLAISSKPKFAPAYLILADLLTYYSEKSKQEEARKAADKAVQLFEELSQKQVSFARGLKRLSISHVIFGGGRYTNNAVMAEAYHVLAKALDGSVLASAADPMPEREACLDSARGNIQKALDNSRGLRDPTRLMLVLGTSAENYLLKGNFQAAIKDAEQAIKISAAIPNLAGFADPHLTMYKAYEADQKYARAVDHLQKFIELNKLYMSTDELKEKVAELERVKRLRDDNKQK